MEARAEQLLRSLVTRKKQREFSHAVEHNQFLAKTTARKYSFCSAGFLILLFQRPLRAGAEIVLLQHRINHGLREHWGTMSEN